MSAVLNLSIHGMKFSSVPDVGSNLSTLRVEFQILLLPKMSTLKSRGVFFRAGLRFCIWDYQDEPCSATKAFAAALALIQLIEPGLSIRYLLSHESPESSLLANVYTKRIGTGYRTLLPPSTSQTYASM